MRYAGLLLIVVAGAGVGLYAAHRLTRRVAVLGQLIQTLKTLGRLLVCSARPMGDLWRQLAQMNSHAACPLVVATAQGLAAAPFSVAFAAAVEQLSEQGVLAQEERDILLAFGAESGQYDLSRQAAQIQGCVAQLEAVRESAAELARTRGQVVRVMGMAGGAALALLLI